MGDDRRFASERIDASDEAQLAELIASIGPDAVLNATDPRFNEPIFNACFVTGTTYLDMAITLSRPHPERPYEEPGVKLGDGQFARAREWEEAGLLALVGIASSPASQTSSPATPPTTSSTRSTRSACAMAPTS
jgi:saccharopine dehydrogenase (NAD+, L-lysine forming)